MSFLQYPAYKESNVNWLGKVPSHWQIFSLKRTVDGCTNGIWGNEPDGENDVAIIRVADFERNNLRVGLKKLTYRSVTPHEYSSRALQKGDLLIEKSGGGEKTLVGCVVLFTHDFEAVTSNFVARMRPLEQFDGNFLCYCFDSLYQRRVNYPAIKQTTGIQNLDSEAYLQERFCFPTLSEQRQIARFLDHETAKIDALIDEQERLIELLQEKRQAVISHAVTKGLDPDAPMKDSGVEWLGEVPAYWTVMPAKFLFSFVTSGSRGWADFYSDTGELFFRITNLTRDSIRPKLESIQYVTPPPGSEGSRAKIKLGDILVSITADLGSVCAADEFIEGGYVSQHVALARPIAAVHSSDWLAYFILGNAAKEQLLGSGYGGTKVQLSLEDIRELLVAVPPADEQCSIARMLDKRLREMESLIHEAKAAVELLAERKLALISAAVTGKIDVRDWEPPVDESAFDDKVRQAGLEVAV